MAKTEQVSFEVQVERCFRRRPFPRTCVEFHNQFPPSRVPVFESLNNQPVHGSYCLLVMSVSTPETAYSWGFLLVKDRCVSCSVQPVCSISMVMLPRRQTGLAVLLLYDNCLAEIARGDCEAICVRDLTLQRFQVRHATANSLASSSDLVRTGRV